VDSPQLRHRIWIVGFLAHSSRYTQRGIREAAGTDRERARQPLQQDDGGLAYTGRERGGQDESWRRENRRAIDRRSTPLDMADSTEPGREGRDSKRAPNGRSPERAEGELADAPEQHWPVAGREALERGWCAWQNSVWMPCADGKLRRAPDDSFDVVNGLHRSILSALGNSIVPQVAYQILKAIKELI
jgi:site-specific DNA-cytosine methylase